MLAFLTSQIREAAQEPVDRDPGVLTLAFQLVRAVRRGGREAFARRCARASAGPSPF